MRFFLYFCVLFLHSVLCFVHSSFTQIQRSKPNKMKTNYHIAFGHEQQIYLKAKYNTILCIRKNVAIDGQPETTNTLKWQYLCTMHLHVTIGKTKSWIMIEILRKID